MRPAPQRAPIAADVAHEAFRCEPCGTTQKGAAEAEALTSRLCHGRCELLVGAECLQTDGCRSAVIEAPENAEANVYVRLSCSSLNGAALDRSWVTYDELVSSGTKLCLSMAAEPDENSTRGFRHWRNP